MGSHRLARAKKRDRLTRELRGADISDYSRGVLKNCWNRRHRFLSYWSSIRLEIQGKVTIDAGSAELSAKGERIVVPQLFGVEEEIRVGVALSSSNDSFKRFFKIDSSVIF